MSATAIILAAGLGTRMKSALPKALHPIAGRPMLRHLIDACAEVFDRVVVVVGPGMAGVAAVAAPHPTVVQPERLGTAHAALQAAPWFGEGLVAVLYADNPLVRADTLRKLLARLQSGDASLALLAMRPPEPGHYGRVIEAGGHVERVVEWTNATEAERARTLCNAGGLCGAAGALVRWLGQVRPDNPAGEYYLTDVVAHAAMGGARVVAVEGLFEELRGINSRAELAAAEATVQSRLRTAAMDAGVGMTAPETVFLSADTRLATDVSVAPYVVFGPGVEVGPGAEIRAFSHLEGCTVAAGAIVGPYARVRPGTVVGEGAHVGNFVELKAARLGRGAKANHLSYLGDVEVGAGANIGAGTITCNYDGVAKHRTVIGEGAFIGSDTALVAPVTVGARAITAAGSVIVRDVAPDALAIARGVQVEKPGRAAEFRSRRASKAPERKKETT